MTNPKGRTVRTRILLLSDTHAALPVDDGADDGNGSSSSSSSKRTFRTPFHAPLPSADVLIHTGDLTMTGSLDEHERALELILSVDAPLKIVIPGNHDLTLDREYYARHHSLHARYARYDDATLDRIQELYSGADARHAGVRYLVEGRESYRLQNGARLNVYASAWQPEFFNWAFGYPRTCDRFNLDLGPDHASPTAAAAAAAVPENPVPDFVGGELGRDDDDDTGEREGGNVDIVLTHGPPMGILDRVARTDESVGCVHLRRAVGRCRPRLHCFGHIHEAWGAVRKRWNDEVVGGRDDTGTNTTPGAGYGGMEQGGASTQGDNLRESNGQFDPVHNPTTVYDGSGSGSGSGSDASVITGESLVKPGSYATQMDRMAAYVDATDLEHGKETVFVNASIMNLRYRAVNAPWLVDLELPVVE